MKLFEKLIQVSKNKEQAQKVESEFDHIKFNIKLSDYYKIAQSVNWLERIGQIAFTILDPDYGNPFLIVTTYGNAYKLIVENKTIIRAMRKNTDRIGHFDGYQNINTASIELLLGETTLDEFFMGCNANSYVDDAEFPVITRDEKLLNNLYRFHIKAWKDNDPDVYGTITTFGDDMCRVVLEHTVSDRLWYDNRVNIKTYLLPVLLEVIYQRPNKCNLFGQFMK